MEDLDKIFAKNYAELTEIEKLEIRELCDDEYGFNALKVVFSQANVLQKSRQAEIKNDPKTKENLDFLFHQKYQNKGILWYNSILAVVHDESKAWYNQRWMKVAAMLVLLVSIYPFIPKSEKQGAVLTAELKKEETKQDTVENEKSESSLSLSKSEVKGNSKAKVASTTRQDEESAAGDVVREIFVTDTYVVPAAFTRAAVTESLSDIAKDDKSTNFELTAKEKLDLLDLLTPTF
jgi:hypothetical protein